MTGGWLKGSFSATALFREAFQSVSQFGGAAFDVVLAALPAPGSNNGL
jgi:hypothetical protein